MEARKFRCDVLNTYGSCNSKLFEKMASKGDVTAEPITEKLNSIVKITGYAVCHIETADNSFGINYYATTDGLFSTGSEIFHDGVVDYIGDTDTFKIVEIKTKKGKTYKAVPFIGETETKEKDEKPSTLSIEDDDIAF